MAETDINKLRVRSVCFNITYKCSMGCVWCDRQLDRLNMDDSHVSVEQTRDMAKLVAEVGWPLKKFRVSGGEPLEHPEFVDVMEALIPVTSRCKVRVSTSRRYSEKLPKLPKHFKWTCRPPVIKNHMPFMVSPEDIGIRSLHFKCKLPILCGLSYDKWGWCFCPVGSVMSRTMGPNVHSETPVSSAMVWDICKHCIYSLPDPVRLAVQQEVMKEHIPMPSPSYQKVVDEHRSRGKSFEKTLHLASITEGKADAKRSNPQRFADAAAELTILNPTGGHGGYTDIKETMARSGLI